MKTLIKTMAIASSFVFATNFANAQQPYDYSPATGAYAQGNSLAGNAKSGVTPFIGSGTTDSKGVTALSVPQPGSNGEGGGWCGYFIPGDWWLTRWISPQINIPCQGVNIGTPIFSWYRGYKWLDGYSYNCPPGYSLEKFVIDAVYDSGYCDGFHCGNPTPAHVSVSYGYTCIKND